MDRCGRISVSVFRDVGGVVLTTNTVVSASGSSVQLNLSSSGQSVASVRIQATVGGVSLSTTYAIAVVRQLPPVTNLATTAGDGQLAVTWTNPKRQHTGIGNSIRWRVQGTTTWLQSGGSGQGLSITPYSSAYTITGLANGTTYEVGVRFRLFSGAPVDPSPWVSTTGTPQGPPAVQSSNANLSGLAASTSTSSGGTFSPLTLTPAFSAATTSYTATVPNARTHAKLTPSVAHSQATVTVRGATVTSGSASAAFPLSVGNTQSTVRVTAQDGTTKDYTVTITRQAQGALPAVRLSASPNPVAEGSPVTVTALLSATVSGAVTIPLTITDNTAEPADHGSLASITIASGATSGTGTITTNQDADFDDETFTVALKHRQPAVDGHGGHPGFGPDHDQR